MKDRNYRIDLFNDFLPKEDVGDVFGIKLSNNTPMDFTVIEFIDRNKLQLLSRSLINPSVTYFMGYKDMTKGVYELIRGLHDTSIVNGVETVNPPM